MKKFVIFYEDKSPNSLTKELMLSHVNFIRDLKTSGRLFAYGPLKDRNKDLLIVEAPSYEDVKRMVYKDPFIQEDYYKKIEIIELIEADESNHYLLETYPFKSDNIANNNYN